MLIPKPVRHLLYPLLPVTIAWALIRLTYAHWGWPSLLFLVIAIPPISIFVSMPIDAFDLWLRRRTRDPIWLLTDEGRSWLDSGEGRKWSAADGNRDARARDKGD